ncbi:MAG: hypothetical protein HY724_08030 [Candidatus Rokubacteria bacterium]|nr:hypothetical protein [Candidatus Rokubacteria bacterium]
MSVLGFLGTTFAGLVVQHQYAAVNQPLVLKALYVAEAGFELVIQELLDQQDYAFNGAAADGVIGTVTSVPVGSGTVTVTKGSQTPPVFTSTGTVGNVSRAIAMTLDVKNLVKLDPVFQDAANLGTNWPETVSVATGGSGISSNALKSWTNQGKNIDFTAYREQPLNPTVPAGSRIMVRLNYMRDRTGAGNTVNRHTLELKLVKSDGGTDTVWSIGPASVSDADRGVWLFQETRGWATSATLTTTKVRLYYDLGTGGAASTSDQAFGWFDNIEVNLVKKSAWSEP